MSQEVKEQMTGGSVAVVGENAVNTENVINGAINVDKLEFSKQGINLFNGVYTKGVTVLDNGTLVEIADSLTVIIPIIGGETYYFRKDTGNRGRLAWHRSYPLMGETLDYYVGDIGSITSLPQTAPADASYMVYTVSSGEGSPNVKLQITTTDERNNFFIGYDFIPQENIGGLIKDKADLYFRDNISNFHAKRFIDLKYSASGLLESVKIHPATRLFYKGTRDYISNADEEIPAPDNPLEIYIYLAIDPDTMELKVGLIDYFKQSFPKEYMLIGIAHPTRKEFYGIDGDSVTINGEPYINPLIIEEIDKRTEEMFSSRSNQSKYFFLEDLKGIYDKPSDIPDGSIGSELDLINANHSVIYDVYDDLVTRFPEYVTKEVVDQDSSGLDINQYTFTAPRVGNENGFHINIPKIIMISAIHGFEQGSAYSSAMFFKDLAENWKNKEQLEFLRWNVDFSIIPVANPYGFDNNERLNFNGVDLNREFGKNKEDMEVEAQVIATMIEDNLDADFYIDYHNIGSGYPMAYTYNDTDRTLMNSLYRTLSKKWAKDYPEAPQDGTMMGYIKGSVANTTVTYATKNGIKMTLLETPWTMPFASAKYDKFTLETGTEALGNLIVAIVKSLK